MLTDYLSALPAKYFEEISAIPRASGNEAAVADYLVDFARQRGLFVLRDRSNNVFIKKDATQGREGESPVLLQSHTDMVAEAVMGSAHDFARDGIKFVQQGKLLRADGTTLGADNGVGVALMLAALDGCASHPALECLFTSSEETGLIGAHNFDYSNVSAKRLVNLDSDNECEITVGCCGGMRTEITLPLTFAPFRGEGRKVLLHGLFGGHSGADVHRGRGNAHNLMGRLLHELWKVTPFCIASIAGGDKDNAIPRECEVVLLPDDLCAFDRFMTAANDWLKAQITCADDAAAAIATATETLTRVLSHEDTQKLLRVLAVPNGILARREDGAPDTSRNLAKIETGARAVTFGFSSRSPRTSTLDDIGAELDALASENGGIARHFARYPGWESVGETALFLAWKNAACEAADLDTRLFVIHAGLECGLITAAVPSMQAISVGCNIHDLHTPGETLELDSFERIWRVLLRFLENC